MILNMHIRRDWRELGMDDPKKRTPTLCGKLTARKFTGVPAITPDQPAFVSEDGRDVGWCLKCCYLAIQDITDRTRDKVVNPDVLALYMKIKNLVNYQLVIAVKQRTSNS